MEALPKLFPKGAAQLVVDLFNLDNLLEGRADKITQRFPRRLTKNAQAGRESPSPIQPGVIRKGGENFAHGKIEAKIMRHLFMGQSGPDCTQRLPLGPDQAGSLRYPSAPASVRSSFPGKSLSTGQCCIQVETVRKKGK